MHVNHHNTNTITTYPLFLLYILSKVSLKPTSSIVFLAHLSKVEIIRVRCLHSDISAL